MAVQTCQCALRILGCAATSSALRLRKGPLDNKDRRLQFRPGQFAQLSAPETESCHKALYKGPSFLLESPLGPYSETWRMYREYVEDSLGVLYDDGG